MVDMIDSGAASKAMAQLLEKIRFTHADEAARSLEAQLPHPPTSDYFNGIAQFMEILKPHGQAIFNCSVHRSTTTFQKYKVMSTSRST